MKKSKVHGACKKNFFPMASNHNSFSKLCHSNNVIQISIFYIFLKNIINSLNLKLVAGNNSLVYENIYTKQNIQ